MLLPAQIKKGMLQMLAYEAADTGLLSPELVSELRVILWVQMWRFSPAANEVRLASVRPPWASIAGGGHARTRHAVQCPFRKIE